MCYTLHPPQVPEPCGGVFLSKWMYIWNCVDEPEYECVYMYMYEQLTSHIFLRPKCYMLCSHPLCRTRFSQYQASSAALGWPLTWLHHMTHSWVSHDCVCTCVSLSCRSCGRSYVAVLCRNRTLFRHVFRLHRCLCSTVSLNFRYGQGSYALHRFIRYSYIYEARMSPTLNGSSAIRCFKHSDAIKIRDGITFDFYTGLPHVLLYLSMWRVILDNL